MAIASTQLFANNTDTPQIYLGEIPVYANPIRPQLTIEYLVVGGGGASGWDIPGGGGAGGYLTGSFTFTSSLYTTSLEVIVGGGGEDPDFGTNTPSSKWFGKNSRITLPTTSSIAIGGGYGATIQGNGFNGGSGGGAAQFDLGAAVNGGLGVAGQGRNGGNIPTVGGAGESRSTGGGGAGQTGSLLRGGDGLQWLDGNYYAGGGGASVGPGSLTGSLGGLGGGGLGGTRTSPSIPGEDGQPNTGGGAGADANGKAGGSGIVIIRYQGNPVASGGDSIIVSSSYTYHKFTSVSTSSFVY